MLKVKCQACGRDYALEGELAVVAQTRCPSCGTLARLVQVPMGRVVNGQPDSPGMPDGEPRRVGRTYAEVPGA